MEGTDISGDDDDEYDNDDDDDDDECDDDDGDDDDGDEFDDVYVEDDNEDDNYDNLYTSYDNYNYHIIVTTSFEYQTMYFVLEEGVLSFYDEKSQQHPYGKGLNGKR